MTGLRACPALVFALLIAAHAYGQSSEERSMCPPDRSSNRGLTIGALQPLTLQQVEALSLQLDALERGDSTVRESHPPIESRIDGDFDGWDGETVFRLQNGQVWQQNAPGAKYLFTHAPRVCIVFRGGSYKMKVEGLNGEIAVRRIE